MGAQLLMKNLLTYLMVLVTALSYGQEITASILLTCENGAVKHATITAGRSQVVSDSTGMLRLAVRSGERFSLHISHPGMSPFSGVFVAAKDTGMVIMLNCRDRHLDEVSVVAERDNNFGISRLNNIEGTHIYAGKKSEAIYVQDLNANLASNNSRQVFSKVPGINIFENDGSGSSIGIGGRGLNPNRISNFNTRQNGYDISADALGYPESYYTPPTEAVERIEILRGAASLQYGTQFGGMINYKFAEPPAGKKFTGNSRQTGGSYGFFNSFNQVMGTSRKISYNAFYQFKHYDGWRSHAMVNSHNAFGSIKYQVSDRLWMKFELTYLNTLSQQPGGLTDKQFRNGIEKSFRSRNWFAVNWNLGAYSAEYKVNDNTKLSVSAFGLIAGRDALGSLGRIDRADDTSANRNLLSDAYRNYGAEARMLHRYKLKENLSHLLVGMRLYNGQTTRLQGDADKSDKPSFYFLNPENLENSSYLFPSRNLALFTENLFQLSKKWSVTPGMRFEHISTASQGYYRVVNMNLAGDTLLDNTISDDRSSARAFILAGIGTQYKLTKEIECYGNISQNYRSINFNDMRVVNPNFQVDPHLQDESGFTADMGVRGMVKDLLYFDASFFYLRYNNRIGTTLITDPQTYQIQRFRTNIGSSRNLGVEIFGEIDWIRLWNKTSKSKLSTFINFSWTDAVYLGPSPAFKNNTVEYVPEVIVRTGLSYAFNKKFACTWQYAYTGAQFSDATNAKYSPSAIYGEVPAYHVMDLSVSWSWKKYGINAGVNNLTNSRYFTRRAEGYPGPGILPADPVNFYLTARYKF